MTKKSILSDVTEVASSDIAMLMIEMLSEKKKKGDKNSVDTKDLVGAYMLQHPGAKQVNVKKQIAKMRENGDIETHETHKESLRLTRQGKLLAIENSELMTVAMKQGWVSLTEDGQVHITEHGKEEIKIAGALFNTNIILGIDKESLADVEAFDDAIHKATKKHNDWEERLVSREKRSELGRY